MSLTLHVLRHAKSSWDTPGQSDHDRPLNRRGRKAAKAIGRLLGGEGPAPTHVLCSTATRAQETWGRVEARLGSAPTVEIDRRLYLASAGELLARIQECRAEPCLLIVAHNPGVEDLARALAGSGDEEAWHRLRASHPTGALSTLEFEAKVWGDIAVSGGELMRFIVPRDLAE